MDMRVKKTRRSIVNAFLELRAKKPLEKITVKELAEKAEINKATFYLHFKDIYDLSDKIEDEIVSRAMDGLNETDIVEHPGETARQMFEAYSAQQNLINIVFGNGTERFVRRIEEGIKAYLFEKHPEWKNDMKHNALLSFLIYGAYYAFIKSTGPESGAVLDYIAEINEYVVKSFR